jgi:phosphate transport system substrate-binding protein
MRRVLSLGLIAACAVALGGGSGCNSKTTGPGKAGTGPASTAPGATKGGPEAKRVNAGGASFIKPMMDKWSSEYNKARGIQVNYSSEGSGAGINKMIEGTFDFGSTDAPMNDKQLAQAKEKGGDVIHVPLAMGAVVPAYKIEGVSQPLTFSGPVLADIFMRKITKWNDDAIKKLNPGVDLPDKPISVVHRSDGSGTTFIFVDYLSKVSPDFEKAIGRGTSVKWPEGAVGAKGNEGVSQYIGANDGAIGYVELIYALSNKIPYGKVINKEGEAVSGSLESVTKAAEAALTEIPEDLRFSLTNASGKESYPIAGTNWAVLYVQQPSEEKKNAIVNFIKWVVADGQQFNEGLHYAKLPKGLVERGEKKLASVTVK